SPNSSLVGLCGGLAAIAVLVFVLPANDVKLAWPWHGLVSSGATVLVGAIAQRVLPARAG
ncbi:MAG: hypothetical protein MUC36_16850, partial [Planctomycetes bacterium]|nr:hypothetical protein [Planctomycetota bacterium]